MKILHKNTSPSFTHSKKKVVTAASTTWNLLSSANSLACRIAVAAGHVDRKNPLLHEPNAKNEILKYIQDCLNSGESLSEIERNQSSIAEMYKKV